MCIGGRSHLGVVHISRLRAVHMVSFCFPQGSALVRLTYTPWYAPQSYLFPVLFRCCCRYLPLGSDGPREQLRYITNRLLFPLTDFGTVYLLLTGGNSRQFFGWIF